MRIRASQRTHPPIAEPPPQPPDRAHPPGILRHRLEPPDLLLQRMARSRTRRGGMGRAWLLLLGLRCEQFAPRSHIALRGHRGLVAKTPAHDPALGARHVSFILRRPPHCEPAFEADPGRVGHGSSTLPTKGRRAGRVSSHGSSRWLHPARVGEPGTGLSTRRGEDWSEREDLNFRPPAPHAGALPGCATLRPKSNGEGGEAPWGARMVATRRTAARVESNTLARGCGGPCRAGPAATS